MDVRYNKNGKCVVVEMEFVEPKRFDGVMLEYLLIPTCSNKRMYSARMIIKFGEKNF